MTNRASAIESSKAYCGLRLRLAARLPSIHPIGLLSLVADTKIAYAIREKPAHCAGSRKAPHFNLHYLTLTSAKTLPSSLFPFLRAVSSGVAARRLRLCFVVARSAQIRNVNHSTLHLELQPTTLTFLPPSPPTLSFLEHELSFIFAVPLMEGNGIISMCGRGVGRLLVSS